MTEVKICGITSLEDAFSACDSGADALGFIFFGKSPRCVSPEEAREIIRRIPGEIAKVGVFVDREIQAVRRIYEHCGLDLIQLHGEEPAEYARAFPSSILIKAVAPREKSDLQGLKFYGAKAFLVDSRDETQYGGTGQISNWELAAAIQKTHAVILAGGLNPDNVEAAIASVSPEAVDVSSGVEIQPGKKDRRKVRLFVEKARAAGQREGKGIFASARGREKGKD
jgi:phosphoribosylanthranilate isomerase